MSGLKTYAIATGVLLAMLAGSFGYGYWKGKKNAPPAPVPAPTVIFQPVAAKESESKAKDVKADENVQTTTTTTVRKNPDGSRTKVVTVDKHKHVAEKEQTDTETKREVPPQQLPCVAAPPAPTPYPSNSVSGGYKPELPPVWMAGLTAGYDLAGAKKVFGGRVAHKLGPIWLGVWADSRPALGLSAEVGWR